jgi:hypothetical protein
MVLAEFRRLVDHKSHFGKQGKKLFAVKSVFDPNQKGQHR